jgi:hypothetical protein
MQFINDTTLGVYQPSACEGSPQQIPMLTAALSMFIRMRVRLPQMLCVCLCAI